jgi:uncharacterized membrane protein YhaH (DUF805 family)
MRYLRKCWAYLSNVSSGRIGRAHYAGGVGLLLVSYYIMLFLPLAGLNQVEKMPGVLQGVFIVYFPVVVLLFMLFTIALHMRRLQDFGLSGWFFLLGPIMWPFTFFMKGHDASNRYGAPSNRSFLRDVFNIG